MRRGNERHEVAVDPAYDAGFDGLHVASPAELVMLRERAVKVDAWREVQEARARCLYSVMRALTMEVRSMRQIRDRLAVVVSLKAPDLLAGVEEWHGRVQWAQVRAEVAFCPAMEWEDVSARVLLEFLLSDGWSEREVGKRVLLLAYAFIPDKSLRPPMAQSFEAIGRAMGLTAENKRSAVSAAMRVLVTGLVHRMQRVSGRRGTGEFWFNKRSQCRAKLSVAMRGKRNRAKGRMTNDECRMTNGEGRVA